MTACYVDVTKSHNARNDLTNNSVLICINVASLHVLNDTLNNRGHASYLLISRRPPTACAVAIHGSHQTADMATNAFNPTCPP